MGSLETQFLALETTVGPVPVLESLALITLTDTLVTLTTALTRSSVTAKKATLVMIYYFLKLFFEDHLFIISISLIFNFVSFPSLPGSRCDQCAPGYYGNPEQPGGQCLPCECHGNIDTEDPDSCDRRTGQCLKCQHHTDGPSCGQCQHGYYGNAVNHDCRRKWLKNDSDGLDDDDR